MIGWLMRKTRLIRGHYGELRVETGYCLLVRAYQTTLVSLGRARSSLIWALIINKPD